MTGVIKANLLLAWIWILAGFVSGALLGLKFHQPGWLGGYASHRRRLYRLGHISFFGLGAVNFIFALTGMFCAMTPGLRLASLAFVAGAVTMPAACFLFAHFERLHLVFTVPVVALLTGAVFTLLELARL